MTGMVVINVVMLSIVLGAVLGLAKLPSGIGGACFLAAASLVLNVMCLFSPGLISQAVLLLFVGLSCMAAKASWRTYAISASVASVAAMTAPVLIVLPKLERLDALRAEYPAESLASRLAYEERPITEADVGVPAPELSDDVERMLSEFETRGSRVGRDHHLQRLHSEQHRQFVASSGFGVIRMAGVSRMAIELPEEDPVPLPEAPICPPEYMRDVEPASDAGAPDRDLAENAGGDSPLSKDVLASTHRNGLEDFLDVDRMGWVQDVDHVAGFHSHRFRSPVDVPREKDEWQVTRLELVSLLRHETPVVYVTDNLPAMNELQDAPTRPLDPFEQSALPMLATEQDLVTESGTNQIRMLGSLRAGTDCLGCHSVQRGELLGAFSYTLDRLRPVREPQRANSEGLGPI